MACFSVVLMLVAALLVSSMMAQFLGSSPVATLRRAASKPLTLSPSVNSLLAALTPSITPVKSSPTSSPTTVNSPPSPPLATSKSPASASTASPSSISSPPSGAPAPTENGAVFNKFTVIGFVVVVIFVAALLM